MKKPGMSDMKKGKGDNRSPPLRRNSASLVLYAGTGVGWRRPLRSETGSGWRLTQGQPIPFIAELAGVCELVTSSSSTYQSSDAIRLLASLSWAAAATSSRWPSQPSAPPISTEA